jgi:hypothetical protein
MNETGEHKELKNKYYGSLIIVSVSVILLIVFGSLAYKNKQIEKVNSLIVNPAIIDGEQAGIEIMPIVDSVDSSGMPTNFVPDTTTYASLIADMRMNWTPPDTNDRSVEFVDPYVSTVDWTDYVFEIIDYLVEMDSVFADSLMKKFKIIYTIGGKSMGYTYKYQAEQESKNNEVKR